jgi:lipopolysaccharide cholinephosphotransferase
LDSLLVKKLFDGVDCYKNQHTYGDFVLDTNLMKDITIPKKIDKAIALCELKEIKVVFDKHNINFFLTHGSCLGAVREKGFIEYDSDIDIGCYKKDINKIINCITELKIQYGFNITKLSLHDESVAIIKNNVIIDISLYKISNKMWTANKHKIFTIPYEFFTKTNKIKFYDIYLNIPINVENYLVYQYGLDWESPIENYYDMYRKNIEIPVKKILILFVNERKASTNAKKIATFVKNIIKKINA